MITPPPRTGVTRPRVNPGMGSPSGAARERGGEELTAQTCAERPDVGLLGTQGGGRRSRGRNGKTAAERGKREVRRPGRRAGRGSRGALFSTTVVLVFVNARFHGRPRKRPR